MVEKAFTTIFNSSYKLNMICLDEKYNQEEMERLNFIFHDENQAVISLSPFNFP